jgi:hypothetical protein
MVCEHARLAKKGGDSEFLKIKKKIYPMHTPRRERRSAHQHPTTSQPICQPNPERAPPFSKKKTTRKSKSN